MNPKTEEEIQEAEDLCPTRARFWRDQFEKVDEALKRRCEENARLKAELHAAKMRLEVRGNELESTLRAAIEKSLEAKPRCPAPPNTTARLKGIEDAITYLNRHLDGMRTVPFTVTRHDYQDGPLVRCGSCTHPVYCDKCGTNLITKRQDSDRTQGGSVVACPVCRSNTRQSALKE